MLTRCTINVEALWKRGSTGTMWGNGRLLFIIQPYADMEKEISLTWNKCVHLLPHVWLWLKWGAFSWMCVVNSFGQKVLKKAAVGKLRCVLYSATVCRSRREPGGVEVCTTTLNRTSLLFMTGVGRARYILFTARYLFSQFCCLALNLNEKCRVVSQSSPFLFIRRGENDAYTRMQPQIHLFKHRCGLDLSIRAHPEDPASEVWAETTRTCLCSTGDSEQHWKPEEIGRRELPNEQAQQAVVLLFLNSTEINILIKR